MMGTVFCDVAAERSEESSLPLPRGAGEALSEEVSRRKLLQVVLVSPQVQPLNAANVFKGISFWIYICFL
jgi:hypothetical protein